MTRLRRILVVTCAALAAGFATASYADRGDRHDRPYSQHWQERDHDERHFRRHVYRDDRFGHHEWNHHRHSHFRYRDSRPIVVAPPAWPIYAPLPVYTPPPVYVPPPVAYRPWEPGVWIATPDIFIRF